MSNKDGFRVLLYEDSKAPLVDSVDRSNRLACIIVTFNSSAVIDDCLTSLLSSGVELSQIFMVDNGSSDDTIAHVSQHYPGVNILNTLGNQGFSKANNFGVDHSSSELLMFVNPDVIFLPGAVEELIKTVSRDKVGICGPLLVNRQVRPKSESYLLPSTVVGLLLLQTYLWKPMYLIRRLFDQLCEPMSVRKRSVISGACMVTSRKDYLEIGGFDERFFMYAEDMDLCERFSQASLGVVQAPAAKVIHIGGSTYVGSRSAFFNSLKSRDALFLKHSATMPSLITKRLLAMIGLLMRWTMCRIRSNSAKDKDLAICLAEGLRVFFSWRLLTRKPLDFS